MTDSPIMPIQPLTKDEYGVTRFVSNRIVRMLLDNGPNDMNSIARNDFTNQERMQFAQLIGYSLTGFGELSYTDEETYQSSQYPPKSQVQARNEELRFEISKLKQLLSRLHYLL